jgi:biopolymer transport protein ExbB
MSLFDVYAFFSRGGWLMVPIAACSVVGLAFFLERIWALRRSRVLPKAFVSRLFELLEAGELQKAEELCRQTGSPLGPMVAAALQDPEGDRETLKERVEEVGQREAFYLEKFVGALGAIATISPLLGLLGTVVGMIDVFQGVVAQSSGGGDVQAAALATGIWQALITTATGLAVAIPIYLAYRYLLSRIDQFAVGLEERAIEAVDCLTEVRGRPVEPDDDGAEVADESENQGGSDGAAAEEAGAAGAAAEEVA